MNTATQRNADVMTSPAPSAMSTNSPFSTPLLNPNNVNTSISQHQLMMADLQSQSAQQQSSAMAAALTAAAAAHQHQQRQALSALQMFPSSTQPSASSAAAVAGAAAMASAAAANATAAQWDQQLQLQQLYTQMAMQQQLETAYLQMVAAANPAAFAANNFLAAAASASSPWSNLRLPAANVNRSFLSSSSPFAPSTLALSSISGATPSSTAAGGVALPVYATTPTSSSAATGSAHHVSASSSIDGQPQLQLQLQQQQQSLKRRRSSEASSANGDQEQGDLPSTSLPVGSSSSSNSHLYMIADAKDSILKRKIRRKSETKSFLSPIVCGLPVEANNQQTPSPLMIDSKFFGRKIEVFWAVEDPKRQVLYSSSSLSRHLGCSNNLLAMYLKRRRDKKDRAIFQATHIVPVTAGQIQHLNSLAKETEARPVFSAPKSSRGAYFLSLEECIEFKSHLARQQSRRFKPQSSPALESMSSASLTSTNSPSAKQAKTSVHSSSSHSASEQDE